MIRGRIRRVRGSMMLEVVIASALSIMVVTLLVSAQVSVLRNYERTLAQNTAQRTTYNALREIREIVQQAMSVSVSGNNAVIILPQRDANGRFRTPTQPDTANPVSLQVNFSTGQLTLTQNGQTRVLLSNILNTTPQGASYAPFVVQQIAPGVTALHIRLRAQSGHNTSTQCVWYEETVLLRNTAQN
ncbi:MAG: hypothetical protein N2651_03855 [Fimbriimonadales bacterium]|nr:hypothetical protein [Fimbriimonadales bacterium]